MSTRAFRSCFHGATRTFLTYVEGKMWGFDTQYPFELR